ncbi:hypothetical protein [Lacisediminihabitans sp. H27-G8]|uniref:hypothetical protein n=1 Tax=Lacisediminihabitans sp. H27-G8 TaxID=3111909 RepID=UPI0038FC7573
MNPADPSTWIVSDTGIGPFQLGSNWKNVTAQLPAGRAPNEECPNPLAGFFDLAGIRIAVFLDDSGAILGVSAGNPFQTPNAATDSGRRPLGGPHTLEGIGYGSTVAELTSAYPSIERPAPDDNENFPRFIQRTTARPSISFTVNLASQAVNDMGVWPDSPPYEYCG